MSKRNRRRNKKRKSSSKRSPKVEPKVLFEKGDFAGAAALLEARLRLEPSEDLRHFLVSCYLKDSDYRRAAETLLSLEDKTTNDLGMAGWCLIQVEDWEEARRSFEEGLRLEKTAEDTYWLAVAQSEGKADYALEEGTKSSVMSLLQSAIELPRCRPEAYLWLARLQKQDQDGLAKRAAILREAIARHPDVLEVRLRLADVLLLRLGDYEGTLDVLAPALEQDRHSMEVMGYAFYASTKSGDFERALGFLSTVGTDPERPEVDLALMKGDTLVRLGRTDEAVACYDEAVNEGAVEQRILGLFGKVWAAVRDGAIERAIDEARRATGLWMGAVVDDDSLFLDMPYVMVGGESISNWDRNACVRATCEALLGTEQYKEALDVELEGRLSYLAYKESSGEIGDEGLEGLLVRAHDLLGHPLIGQELAYYRCKPGKIADGVRHHLSYCLWKHATRDPTQTFPSYLATLDFVDWEDKPTVGEGDHAPAHRAALDHLEACDEAAIRDVMVPFYTSFWRKVLFEARMFGEVVGVTGKLLAANPDAGSVLFDRAYGLSATGRPTEAEAAYNELLERQPENANAMHNLSILLEERGLFEKALQLSAEAARLSPDDQLITDRAAQLEKNAEARRKDLQRKEEFLSTAPVRWPQLDYYKKQLLVTLDLIDGFDDFGHLSRLSGIEERFLRGHYRKLVEAGMVVDLPGDGFEVNEHIVPLVRRERSHSIATKVIHAEPNIAYKPIFNSRQEYTVYNILIGIFPNHLVFPNMALQTIFQYDRMKGLLAPDEFRYFLMSQADFCVTSTANYLPMIAFELDSDYHDSSEQLERDAKKDRIFRLGGVPLLRLRSHGRPSVQDMRQDIVEAVRALVEEISAASEREGIYAYVLREIETASFESEGGPNPIGRDRYDHG